MLFRATPKLLYRLLGWSQKVWSPVGRGDGDASPNWQGRSQKGIAQIVNIEHSPQLGHALCWCILNALLVGTELINGQMFQIKVSDILFTR